MSRRVGRAGSHLRSACNSRVTSFFVDLPASLGPANKIDRHGLGPCVQGVQQDTLRAMGWALVALASSDEHMPASAGRRPRASL